MVWREAWDCYDASVAATAATAAYANDAQYISGVFHGSSLSVDLLECEASDGHCGCVPLVHDAQCQDHAKMQMVGDSKHEAETPWKTDVWAVERRVLGAQVRETYQKVVPAEHTPTTSESKSCLQPCGKHNK